MEQAKITITPAGQGYRLLVIELLNALKLPTADLPANIGHFYVALDGAQLAGVIGYEVYNPYFLLRSLAVAKAYRNQGVADKLVVKIEETAQEQRIEQIYLLTETAEHYFAKKGYIPVERSAVPEAVKRSTEFSHVCPQSAVAMVKKINTATKA